MKTSLWTNNHGNILLENAKKHELITACTIPTMRQNECQQPHSPVSKLENGKIKTFVGCKCFVNIAQGWIWAKCLIISFPTFVTKVVAGGRWNWMLHALRKNAIYINQWITESLNQSITESLDRSINQSITLLPTNYRINLHQYHTRNIFTYGYVHSNHSNHWNSSWLPP